MVAMWLINGRSSSAWNDVGIEEDALTIELVLWMNASVNVGATALDVHADLKV
jgi:hypothetical protein